MKGAKPSGPDEPAGFRDLQAMAAPRPAPKPAYVWQRYPLMLSHPDHQDAVQTQHHTQLVDQDQLYGGRLEQWTTPGSPERYPPRIAHNEKQEAAAIADGYRVPAGVAAPTEATATEEVPAVAPQQYPKWLPKHDRAVASFEEELSLMPPEQRAAAEAERASRPPVLSEFTDVERYTQATVAWHLAHVYSTKDLRDGKAATNKKQREAVRAAGGG